MPNFAISDMAPATLPLVLPDTWIEIETLEGGVSVSRKVQASEIGGGAGGVASVNSGVNITVDNVDPLNPIVNFAGNTNLLPDTDVTHDVGSDALRWKDVFAQRIVGVGGDLVGNLNFVNVTGDPVTSLIGDLTANGGGVQINIDGDGGQPLFAAIRQTNYDLNGNCTANLGPYGNGSVTLIDQAVIGGIGTIVLNNTGAGSLVTGRMTAGYGNVSTINHRAAGGFVLGYTAGYGGNALIESANAAFGSFMSGNISAYGGDGTMRITNGPGVFMQGYVQSYAPGFAALMETGPLSGGAFVQGTVYADTGNCFLGTSAPRGAGSFVQGYAKAYNGGGDSEVRVTARGCFAQGFAYTYMAPQTARINATADGAFAQGFAYGGDILANGVGSFAHGYASYGYDIAATAEGAFASGYAVSESIIASAMNSVQFGHGSNALPDSLQVGNAGLRLKGTIGAPGAPQNGDIFIVGTDVVIRSGGVSVIIA